MNDKSNVVFIHLITLVFHCLPTIAGFKLSHACSVFPLRRNILRRLLDLLKGHSSKKSCFIRLNNKRNLSIEWWWSFLLSSERVYFISPAWVGPSPRHFSVVGWLWQFWERRVLLGRNVLMALGWWPNNRWILSIRKFFSSRFLLSKGGGGEKVESPYSI